MEYAYGNWFVAVALSGLFLWFAYGAFKPKTRIDWRSFGAFSAFIITLFTEWLRKKNTALILFKNLE